MLDLRAAGKTKVIREVRPLVRVNESIADVEAGRSQDRVRALKSGSAESRGSRVGVWLTLRLPRCLRSGSESCSPTTMP